MNATRFGVHRSSRDLRLCAFISMSCLCAISGSHAFAAIDLVAMRTGWNDVPIVKVIGGNPGDMITIEWKAANGALYHTSTHTLITGPDAEGADGRTIRYPGPPTFGGVPRPAKGDSARANGKQPDVFLSSAMDLPNQPAVAVHNIATGTAVAFGQEFVLSGGYTLQATSIDRDISSPDFGNVSGEVLSESVTLLGESTTSGDFFELSLSGDTPFTANLGTFWSTIGASPEADFTVPLSGMLAINGASTVAFSGVAMGTAFYSMDMDGVESHSVVMSLTTEFGPVEAMFVTSGIVTIIPTPGPVVLFFLAGALAARRHGR